MRTIMKIHYPWSPNEEGGNATIGHWPSSPRPNRASPATVGDAEHLSYRDDVEVTRKERESSAATISGHGFQHKHNLLCYCGPRRVLFLLATTEGLEGGGGGTLQGGNGRGVDAAEVTTASGVSAVPSKIMRLRLCQTTHMSWSAAVCWRSLGGAGWHRRALSDHAGGAGAGGVPERGKRWLMSSIPSRQKGHRSVPKTPWRWRKPCVRVLRVAVAETS
jgi:hypothetical protein